MLDYLKQNLIYLITILIALITFWGGLVYRIYSLNNIGAITALTIAILTFIILYFSLKTKRKDKVELTSKTPKKKSVRYNIQSLVLHILLFTIYYLLFTTLFKSQATNALISPWQATPTYFFALYLFSTLILAIIILQTKFYKLKATSLISAFYLLSFSIALIIYKIGYGFDPFIHQATVDLIDKAGSVDPKPLYYLGQYGLITILHKITTISLVWLDKLLVPILAALMLPTALYQFLKKYFSDQKTNLFLVLAILILPFTFFIVTTPQNLAYLFLILTILYGLTCSSLIELIVIYVFALASLITHPIAGLPALLFALTLTVYHSDKEKIKKYAYSVIFILSSMALPLAFVFLNKANTNQGAQRLNGGSASLKWLNFEVPSQENFILNFVYLYAFNLKFIIAILILAGIALAYRHQRLSKIFFLNLGLAIALLFSYFLTKLISFDFLIDYEQGDFPQRILFTSLIFCLPFILITLYWLIDKILKQKLTIKIPWLVFFVILITASLYISYPRHDRYFNSHGFSVSQADIDAVQWIEDNAQNNYIVLANQQVSVAALREFGFSKYYIPSTSEGEGQGEVFYYPIPTSSPLYQFYLSMVYDYPTKKTMAEAMELAGVNESYFVLNKYWWAFPKILAEAKLEADNWQKIDNGEIYIFKYSK